VNALLVSGVAGLGGLGAVLRFLIDRRVSRSSSSSFPIGTLVVNLSGAFVLGLLVGIALSGDQAVLAQTAIVGSYTTFSTWMLETQRAVEERQLPAGVVNVVVSVVFGIGAAALGQHLGGAL
jgi:fluoride exporter